MTRVQIEGTIRCCQLPRVYIQYVTQSYKYISAEHQSCERKKRTFSVEEELRAEDKRCRIILMRTLRRHLYSSQT